MPDELLTQEEIDSRLAVLADGWAGSPRGLRRSIEFADFPTAVDFIGRIAPKCEEMNHHPDLDLRWRRVDVAIVTHSAGGVTAKDVALAKAVDEVASRLPMA